MEWLAEGLSLPNSHDGPPPLVSTFKLPVAIHVPSTTFMSSFKRRAGPSSTSLPTGCIPSPSSSQPILSTGIPSLDDVLGGGLPLGSTTALLAPDEHSAWGRLVERYVIAQGLAAGQDVILVGGDGDVLRELARGCMWVDGAGALGAADGEGDSDAEGLEKDDGTRTRIAWRYDKMKRFETSVQGRPTGAASNFSHALSLTHNIPFSVLQVAEESGQLTYLAIDELAAEAGPSSPFAPMGRVLCRLEELLRERNALEGTASGPQRKAVRIVLHEVGDLSWGDGLRDTHVMRFLHALRCLVSRSTACAIVTLSPALCAGPPTVGLPHSASDAHTTAWQTLLSRCVDTSLLLSGFSSSPALSLSFPHSHGLLDPLALPSRGALLPPAFRHSTLLGLSAGGGAGQNNLAFRAKRKRWVVETLHLGVEGGVGERRTEPPKGAAAASGAHTHAHGHEHSHAHGHNHAHVDGGHQAAQGVDSGTGPARSAVRVGFDLEIEDATVSPTASEDAVKQPLKPARKKVAFQHDKPELYEF